MKLRMISEDPNATVDYKAAGTTVDDTMADASSFHSAASELNPNELMEKGTRPQSIIYTGRLYVDPDESGRAHASFYLLGGNKNLKAELGRYLTVDPNVDTDAWRQEWRQLYSRFLFGRVAWIKDRRVVSFWGSGSGDGYKDIKGPDHMVGPCLYALYTKNVIDDDTTAVLGNGAVAKVGDLLLGGEAKADPAEAERMEMAKRMHLAGGDEKKAIMKKLGVGGGGSAKTNKWDDALRKIDKSKGGLSPGQSRWRMSSESLSNRLDRVLGL